MFTNTSKHCRAALVALAALVVAPACGGDKTDASTTGAAPAATAGITAAVPASPADTGAAAAQPTKPSTPTQASTATNVEQQCCCKVAGKANENVGMSRCVKDLKGACVKAAECPAAPAAVGSGAWVSASPGASPSASATAAATATATATAGADTGPAFEQRCCCKAAGKPTETVGMSECNKTRKGACVKAAECKK